MTGVKGSGQRTSQDKYDVPGPSPETPPPFTSPDEPVNQQNEPPSIELEGERISYMSCDIRPTSSKMYTSGALESVEYAMKRSMNLRKTSECVNN
jgi:hypothetical protein